MAPVASVLLLASCSSPTPVAPTPVTPGAPKISCPAPVTVKSNSGSLAVVYGAATASFGSPPVNVVCTPASGSVFPVGSTTVSCTATDQLSRTDACSFIVTVTAPPIINATTFLAWGDSMTAGEVVSEGQGLTSRALRVDTAVAYPTDLQTQLATRYASQTIVVLNRGVRGDTTAQMLSRLTGSALASAQAFLLMGGANDLPQAEISATAIPAAVNNMRSMVEQAKNAGMSVFVATLPPEISGESCLGEGPSGHPTVVDPYNVALRTMIASEAVTLVDVAQAFGPATSTLIDCDGLHLTPAGYHLLAQTFFTGIVAKLERPGTSPQRSTAVPLFNFPRRR
jgi:lysophospholipase L1-like esterase